MLLLCLTHNLLGWHHHTHIDDLIAVAGHHHPDDVLADIVYITLYRCQQHLSSTLAALSLLCLDSGLQDIDGLFHRTGCLHHLGQEHLSFAEEFTHLIHTCHQRTFDDIDSMGIFLQCFLQIFLQILTYALHQCLHQTVF